jgi:SnoaL-like domain
VKLETPCSGAPRRTIRDWEDSMSKTEDELAIRQLAAAYADACNRMNPVDMAAVYAEDGELVALQFSEKPMKGREKLQRIFANLISERDFIFYMIFSGIVNLDGDKATARWWVSELRQVKGADHVVVMLACFQDDVVRLAEGWRFSRRVVKPMFHYEVQAKDLHLDAPPFVSIATLPGPLAG